MTAPLKSSVRPASRWAMRSATSASVRWSCSGVAGEAAEQAVGDRRPLGEAGGERDRLGGERLVLDDPADQAPVGGLLRRDALAEHHHLHRPRPPGEARQQPGRAGIGDQADIDEGLQEIGRPRRR